MRVHLHLLAVLSLLACTSVERENHAMGGSHPAGSLPDSCFSSDAARRYIQEVRLKVLRVLRPPAAPGDFRHVDLYIQIDANGRVTQVYSAEPENPLSDAAISAVRNASPFSVLPPAASCIANKQFLTRLGIHER